MQPIITSYQEAPSNIAIIKYWGKKGIQEPMNPSLSFTLNKARTKTNVSYLMSDEPLSLYFLFEGQRKESFIPKLETFINNIRPLLPFLLNGKLSIDSTNTFPHSSGIASSASSMAALAKTLIDISIQLGYPQSNSNELISEIARLGSGSACRSTQNGWVLWGETPLINGSSNRFGIEINHKIHHDFTELNDSILVIRKGSKSVSSSLGHALMNNHPYQEGRMRQANNNLAKLIAALESGNFNSFAEVCEEEALSLHGLMLSSSPGYMLLAPESVAAIERIKSFREHQQLPITFTIDAGPNIHIIYPKTQSEMIMPFIEEQLVPLCEDQTVIYDEISMK